MQDIVRSIIDKTFMVSVGKHQVVNQDTPKAMKVTFRGCTNYDVEEGYRTFELVIYGPLNYVQVWSRECWDVISVDDLEYDDEGYATIKKGSKGYVEGASEWTLLGDHDSGWRDGIDKFFRDNKKNLNGLKTGGQDNWFEVVAAESLNLPGDE